MRKNTYLDYKNLNIISILIIVLSLSISFFYELYYGFQPCVLCTLQRVCFVFILILLILKTILKTNNNFFKIFPTFFIVLGLALSGRQIILQNSGSTDEESYLCSPIIESNFDIEKIMFFIDKVFSSKGSCSEVSSILLGLSFASWSLIIFILLLVLILISNKKEGNT